jgi:hypothetical protein
MQNLTTKMKRIHDTPRTDAVLNTFDGNQSKLAADLATHAEELERELTDMRRIGCMARLVRLSDCWKGRAAKKFMDAKGENDEMGRKLIEHGAMCYFNAATELEEAINQIQATTFAEWYEARVGITLEQAKREGVYDLTLLEEAFNFPPNSQVSPHK